MSSSNNDDVQVYEAEPVDQQESCNVQGYTGNLVHSFGHSLIQGPIDGVREIVNTFAGSKVVPNIQVIKPPEKKEVSSPEWEAQKIGSGAGLIAALIVVGTLLTRRR